MLVIDLVDKGVRLYPDREFVRDDRGVITYREMGRLTKRVAAALVAAGIRPDTKVALFTSNFRHCFSAQYGTFRAGAIWVPINFRNTPVEACAILRQMDAEFLFFHSTLADTARRAMTELQRLRGCVCLDKSLDFAPSLEQWIEPHEEIVNPPVRTSSDIAGMMITSGTTGQPKGVELPNRAFVTMMSNMRLVLGEQPDPVHLVVAPLTHAAGAYAMGLMYAGATHVILSKTEPLSIMEAIERHRITTLFLPPTLIYMILAHPDLHKFDYSSLQVLLYGAAPMSAQKLREAIATFGPVLNQAYGQTEALMMLTALSAAEHVKALSKPELEHRLWSAGREAPLVRVEIMDDRGRILPDGQRGEVVARSDIIMNGYYKDPEATAAAGYLGWHHTGDIGYRDDDGFIYIVDRKKDMIISGGFNLFSIEIEQAVTAHPAVQDCAVVGIPDEKWGETVLAAIELKPGCDFDEAEMIRFCKERIGSLKAPKKIVVVDSLPRSTVGKVLRREVRAPYWVGRNRAV
jgi:acyl-CoA synthetase (AMP-forming)/AMP-acid ligase II